MAFVQASEFELVTSGLGYPESPVYEPDGSILLVEIKGERLTRVRPDGSHQKVADIKGGPNGAALGPDGKIYIANNGGFDWIEIPLKGQTLDIGTTEPAGYQGGRIERVDLSSGAVEAVYTTCDRGFGLAGLGERVPKEERFDQPVPLRGPDDLVFDHTGGFWISDFGKQRTRERDITGIFYAPPGDGPIAEMVFPLTAPNGICLSPEGDRIYTALTNARQVLYWELSAPGRVKPNPGTMSGAYLLTAKLPGQAILDSMAADEDGNLYVATMLPEGDTPMSNGGIAVVSPDGQRVDFMEIRIEGKFAPLPSSLCFGGADRKTMYVTCGASGLLVKARVHVPGLALHFNPYD